MTQGPVRVLQVLATDAISGTELMVAELVKRLDRSIVDCEIATLAPGSIAARLRDPGLAVRSLGEHGVLRGVGRLAAMLRDENFDVVSAYGFKTTAAVRIVVRIFAPRTSFICGVRALHVSELERVDSAKSRFVLLLERLGSRFVDVYDANSPGALETLASAGIARRKLTCIPNGVDIEMWDENDRTRSPDHVPLIACIARFVPIKRHEDLIRAAALLAAEDVRFRVVFAGAGRTLDRIRRLAATLEVADQVEFRGELSRPAVRQLLDEADIFCLPSLSEGMPGSLMEAMASGLPVVATRVNGVDLLVDHRRTGLLVPPGDPSRLADALGALLRDSDKRRQLGRAGRARIVEQFDVDRMVAAKADLYRSVARA